MRYEYPFGPISNVQKEVQKAYEKKNYDASFFVPLLDFDSIRINDDIKTKKPWQITYYYQYIENDLDKVISLKLRKRDPHFMAKDLYCILKTACCGMALLQSRGLVHGDLDPACIQINSHGSPLLMLPWQQGPDSSILNYTADMPIYCSPELFRSYARNSGTDSGFDKYKSDVFSIGLIVCYAGLLKPVQHIYDRNTNTVRVDAVTKLVEEFVQLYYAHRELCSIVSSCLNVRAELRPDFSKLKADFFSFATIADVPQYDVTSKFKPFGINEGLGHGMTAVQFVPGQSGVNVAQPLGQSKGHAFEGISYIDPTQVGQNQENHQSNVGPNNRFSHPDPTGFGNTSLWNWNAPGPQN